MTFSSQYFERLHLLVGLQRFGGNWEEMRAQRRESIGSAYQGSRRAFDETDRRILSEITLKPILPVSKLAQRVGRSRPAVAERLRRLEERGVIVGWTVQLDPASLGRPIGVVFRIRPTARLRVALEDVIQRSPAVVECLRTTGEQPLLVRAQFATIQEFEEMNARFQQYGETVAIDILSALVPLRPPPVPTS